MIPASLQNSLRALRQAGSVFGVVLARQNLPIFEDTALSGEKIAEVLATLDDICRFFEQEKRHPDQLVFGYDGGSLLVLLSGPFRLVVFFHLADEIDFVGRTARALFKDFEMAALVSEGGLASAKTTEAIAAVS